MRVKDLPGDTKLDQVKVRLPCEHKRQAISAGLMVFDVFIISQWHAGIWVKSDLTSQRMYPITGVMDHSEILEWEVVE